MKKILLAFSLIYVLLCSTAVEENSSDYKSYLFLASYAFMIYNVVKNEWSEHKFSF